MSADLLRRAAAKLRELDHEAMAEITTCPGYATTDYREYLLAALDETEERTPVVRLAVTLSPAVAGLLAASLEATARSMGWLAPYRPHEQGYEMWTSAVAAARAILGEVADA